MKRKGFGILFALALVLGFTMATAVSVAAGSTFAFPGGSLTTTDTSSWGGYSSQSYGPHFNVDAGPLTIEYLGVNAYPINYTGDFGWPPDPTDTGASVIVGVGNGVDIAQYSFKSNMSGSQPRGTSPETYGKGSWDYQNTGHWNDDGYRSYLFQGQFTGNWAATVGNSQYNAEKHGGPTGNDPDYDTFDFKFYVEKVAPNTYEVTGWHNLWKSSAIDEGCYWDWNYAKNAHDPAKRGYLKCFEGTWTADGGLDLSDVQIFLAIQNWQGTQPEPHTFDWDSVVVTGTVIPPDEVWVDDSWAGSSPGDLVDGHTFGYDAFDNIQDGVDAVAGSTVHVAAGTYAGAIVTKNVTISGAGGGGSVINSGVPYKTGGAYDTAFRLDSGADGTEINNFTINNNEGASFYFAVFARGVDDVSIDSLQINDTVQGITNWGGSGWTITNNTVTDTVAAGGGGIAVFLGATPPSYRTCSDNLIQYNTIDASATAETYSCPGICLALDTRYGAYDELDGSEDISGNQILDNTITASGANNGVGIEVGTILGDSEEDPDRTDPVKIAAIMDAAAVHDNTVQDNTADGADMGIYFYNVTNLTITENTVQNNVGYGMYAEHGQSGTVITDNTFTNNDVQLMDDTDDTDTLDPLDIATILSNNTFDCAVTVDHPGASLLHVIWSSIQDGIDAAVAGDTVNVAAGTYIERLVIDKQLTLQGAGSASTIIDATGGSPGIMLTASGVSPSQRLTIKGLTVRNSTLDGIRAYKKAGDINLSLYYITLEDVILTLNGARGMEIHNDTIVSDLEIKDCEFVNNTAQGLRTASNVIVDGMTITDSKFNGNSYGIYLQGTINGVTILGSEFNSNVGHGGYMTETGPLSNLMIEGSQFNGNYYGLVVWNERDNTGITIRGSSFQGNDKGGIWMVGDNLTNVLVEKCEVLNNDVLNSGVYGITFGAYTNVMTNVGVHFTNIDGQTGGIENYSLVDTAIVDATLNWWGYISGPHHPTSWYYYGVEITNPDGQGAAVTDYVLYEPWTGQQGMATGGGWFIPEDSSRVGLTPGGKATFGFVAKHKNETSSGQLEFQYHADELNLKSTSYDWVTVSNTQVIFEGEGRLNDEEGYKFRVWAFDGDKAGGQPDRFAIRIWTNSSSFESPTYRAEGNLGGGQIVVHKK